MHWGACYLWWIPLKIICNSTNPMSGIPGIWYKHIEHENRSTVTDDSLNSEESDTLVVPICSPGEDLSTFHRYPGGHKATSTYISLTHYCALQDLKIKTLHQLEMVQVTKEVQVDLRWWATQLPIFPNSETRGHNYDRVRCLEFRLRCSLLGSENGGKVDTSGSTTPHQLSRVEGNFLYLPYGNN